MKFLKPLWQKITAAFGARHGGYRERFAALSRTTTFKVAFSFAGLFLTFALIILGYIWFMTIGLLSYDADKAARNELSVLTKIWETQGVNALNVAVIERASQSGDLLLVLITPDGEILSGNIDTVPMDLSKVERPKGGTPFSEIPWQAASFTYSLPESGSQTRAARGVFFAGPDGYGLFVARDFGPGFVIAERVVRAVWAGSLIVLAFALIGGYLAAKGAAGRVDQLSKTTKRVMDGDLSVRAPVNIYKTGRGDEFDALTTDLNAMLERTERLVQASRTIGDAIAHDLRSPLTRLRAYLENASSQAKTKEELQDALGNSALEIDNIVATFNAVLRLSRLEAGQGAIKEKFNLSETLVELAELYEYSFEDKSLKFKTDIEQGLEINGDRSLIIQALTNLLENALKYTEIGEVIMSAHKRTDKVEIAIADSGKGIPENLREKAKKRFERLDAARSTQGSGLGLSLAQAIAEAHDGELILGDGIALNGNKGLKASIIVKVV